MGEMIRREKTILTNNVAQSKTLVYELLLEDVLSLQKKEELLLHTSKSLLSAQDDYDWRTSPDHDFIKLFPRFIPVLHTI